MEQRAGESNSERVERQGDEGGFQLPRETQPELIKHLDRQNEKTH